MSSRHYDNDRQQHERYSSNNNRSRNRDYDYDNNINNNNNTSSSFNDNDKYRMKDAEKSFHISEDPPSSLTDDIPDYGSAFVCGKSRFEAEKFHVKEDPILQISCGDEHTGVVTSLFSSLLNVKIE
jgi:hypothetical protein